MSRATSPSGYVTALGEAGVPTVVIITFLKVYMELGSYFLFLQEQIKDIIIISALFFPLM
jgi:hypothetical protein